MSDLKVRDEVTSHDLLIRLGLGLGLEFILNFNSSLRGSKVIIPGGIMSN